jgi:spore germination cell wall hydrolase CwlJ-like protein
MPEEQPQETPQLEQPEQVVEQPEQIEETEETTEAATEVEPQLPSDTTSRGLRDEQAIIIPPYTEFEVIALAQTLQQEAGGLQSMTEKSAVVWTVLNRVDSGKYSQQLWVF